ncbi:MAG: OmpA family protein [Deltaproteobacteria bacterium]
MKKMVSVFVILMLMTIVTAGYAQVNAGSVNITPTIGFYKFEGNEDLESTVALGLRAGYFFTKYIGIEGYAHYVPTAIVWGGGNPNSDIKFVGYGIEGIVNLLPNSAFVPFIAVGVGGAHYSNAFERTTENKRDKVTADYGAGVKYFLSENIALRADVRHIIPFADTHHNLLGTVGLTFAFGGAKKAAPAPEPAPAPVVLDSDRDGVPDNADKCPGTPAGVAVDENGCPLDSDKDGVPDYLDKCPGTPAGVKVDRNGCPPPVVQEVKKEAAAAPEILEKGRTTLNVLFDTNKSIIKKNSFKDVDALVDVMKNYPELNVVIEGHTDSVGSAASNKKLSQRRADAVKKYMVSKGIDANRLSAVGFGLEKPVASNATKEGRAKNRRVEAAADYVIKK